MDIFICHIFFLSPHSQSFVCFQSLIFHLRYLLHFLITSFPSHSFSFLPFVHPFFHAVILVFCSQMPFSPHCPPLKFYFLTFCLSSQFFCSTSYPSLQILLVSLIQSIFLISFSFFQILPSIPSSLFAILLREPFYPHCSLSRSPSAHPQEHPSPCRYCRLGRLPGKDL